MHDMKKILIGLLAFLLPLTASASILGVQQGGTASSSLTGILVGNGISPINTLTIGSNLTLTGTTLSASGGGGSGAWPFTPSMYDFPTISAANQSTTTPLWLKNTMVIASSTYFTNASTTGLTVSGSEWHPNLTSQKLLALDQNGLVIASSTIGNAQLANSSITVNGTTLNLGDSKTITAASSTLLIDNNTFSTTGTTTFSNALQLGSTAGDNMFKMTAARGYPASVTTGGMFNGNCSTFDGACFVLTASKGSTNTGRMFVLNQTNSADVQDMMIASSSGANVTALNIKGEPTGKGILKIEHTGNGTGFSNSSALSIDVSPTDAQGIFIKNGTGVPFTVQNSGSATLYKLDLNGNATTTGYIEVNGTGTSTIAGGLQLAKPLNITNTTASSTFANGINLSAGCFSIAGACIGAGGGSTNPAGSGTELQYRANGTTFGAITSSAFDGTHLSLATTTAAFASFTVGSSTVPQLALSDNTAADNLWTFRNSGGNLFLATSTALATSSVTALQINGNSTPSLAVGTTTSAGILNLGTQPSTNGTSTVMMGKIQFDGYNSAGTRTCVMLVGTAFVIVAGACTP